jgi:tetratricopeptide (TPR) repeat protein
MSIIHDALKKAESERQPMTARVSMSRAARGTGRRGRWSVLVSLLMGTALLGTGAWLWVEWQGPFSAPVSTRPITLPHAPVSIAQARVDEVAHEAPSTAPPPEAAVSPPVNGMVSAEPGERAGDAESAFATARAEEAAGRWDTAMQHYRRAIGLDPTLLEARNNLGTLLIHRGEIAAAITEFQAVLMIKADYVLARNNLGSAYLLNGEEALAIQEFLAAVRADGAYVSPYFNLALLYARRSDVDQSVAFLTKALALEPKVLSWVQDDADFDSIRGAPGFQRLWVQRRAKR